VLAIKNSKKSRCIGCVGDCSNCPSKINFEKNIKTNKDERD